MTNMAVLSMLTIYEKLDWKCSLLETLLRGGLHGRDDSIYIYFVYTLFFVKLTLCTKNNNKYIHPEGKSIYSVKWDTINNF